MRAKAALIVIFAAACLVLICGCVDMAPKLVPDVTLAPRATATSAPTPEPAITETPAPSAEPTLMLYDALGDSVLDETHFQKYITFKGIQVYEHSGDTFVVMIAKNDYPEPIVCALDIAFFDGKGDSRTEVARGKLQTRDAQYILILQPGENTLFATIDTDMTLTGLDFKLEYDEELGVLPE